MKDKTAIDDGINIWQYIIKSRAGFGRIRAGSMKRKAEKDMKKAICMLLVMMMIIGATVTAQAAG